jgi:hypothetical protein
VTPLVGGLDQLDELVRHSSERIADFCRSGAASESAVHLSSRSRLLVGAVRNAAADALIVTRSADRQAVCSRACPLAGQRRRHGGPPVPRAGSRRAETKRRQARRAAFGLVPQQPARIGTNII